MDVDGDWDGMKEAEGQHTEDVATSVGGSASHGSASYVEPSMLSDEAGVYRDQDQDHGPDHGHGLDMDGTVGGQDGNEVEIDDSMDLADGIVDSDSEYSTMGIPGRDHVPGDVPGDVPEDDEEGINDNVRHELNPDADAVSLTESTSGFVTGRMVGEWEVCEDPGSGTEYFYHPNTGESAWQLPVELQRAYYSDPKREL